MKDKEILKGISGVAKSGEVLAIMGPSGAGKTMLLNLLTLEDGPGEVSGDVRLNGKPLTRREFQKHCAVVTQVDRHWAFLTCRESVALSADLYLGDMSAEEKAARVDVVLKRTGLESCADTKGALLLRSTALASALLRLCVRASCSLLTSLACVAHALCQSATSSSPGCRAARSAACRWRWR